MGPCSIKDSAEAWNDGIDAFKKAFKQTGGKTTESIRYAIEEVNKKYPDLNFDHKSFYDPLIKSLKKNELVDQNYQYNDGIKKTGLDKKIAAVTEKMNSMTPDQKKSFARDVFTEIQAKGSITEQKVKDVYAEAVGMPSMNKKVEEQIDNISTALKDADEVETGIYEKIKEMQAAKDANGGKLSEEDDKRFQKEFADLADKRAKAREKSMDETAKLGEFLAEKKFWLHQLGTYMPLNLMNPNSLIKNASGAIADALTRSIGNTIASPISKALSTFTKINSNPIGARLKGALTQAEIRQKARAAWEYGKTDFSQEIPQSDFLSATKRFSRAMDESGLNKATGIISSILKIHPSLISAGLSVPDAMVYEMTRAAELERIAEAKGLTGAEKQAFMMDPDEKSMDISTKLSAQATFKQDLPGFLNQVHKFFAYDPHEASKKIISEGKMSPLSAKLMTGLYAIALKTTAPFVKTPINIVRTASKLLLPEYEVAQAIYEARKESDPVEKQRLYVDGISKGIAGFFVRSVAIQMVTNGLISAGYDDEDKKTKDIIEQKLGGANRINLSALMRGLTMRDMTAQKGDVNVDLNSLGALGIVLGAYAHAWNGKSRDEIEQHTQYSKNLLNAIGIPMDVAMAQIAATMDFTFMTGINNMQRAIKNGEGYERQKLGIDLISNIFTGVVPSTVQKLSTQESPYVKKQFDSKLTFTENLQNALGYRFAFQNEDLKNKYFSLAEEGKPAIKKKKYMFFDNYLGRVLDAEFNFLKLTKDKGNDNPISRLYDESRKVPKEERDKLFPSGIDEQQTIYGKTKSSKFSYKADLTPKQYDYLQERTSNLRMMMATPFIMDKNFQDLDFETKTKTLQAIYQKALDYAKQDMKSEFRDELKKQEIEGTREKAKRAKKLSQKYTKR